MSVGFGGFFDGIVVHQLLQWHHMVSHTDGAPVTTVKGLEANTFADGLFHASTYLFVLVGTLLLVAAWQQGRIAPNWSFHLGLLVAGWGAFNLVEGLVDHQILGIHHVRDDLGSPLSWDLGFLALGALMIVIGWSLHRAGHRKLAPHLEAAR